MTNRRKKNKSNKKRDRNKPVYKGPYQSNPNLQVHNVRKSMRPENEGPTVDTFSELDSTINMLPNEENDIRSSSKIKRPTKEKQFIISTENIFITIFTLVAAGIGILVYSHSNKFVSVEKDIEYIKADVSDQNSKLDKVEDKINSIDKKVDLIDHKIDSDSEKKK